jgi:hypothetical protein
VSDNPFLAGVELSPRQRAQALEPGQRVRVRYHTLGSGLGGGRYDFEAVGEVRERRKICVEVREDRGGVVNDIPICWIDELEVLDA